MVEPDSQWPRKACEYALQTPVGQGAFGLVWDAKLKSTGERVAVKIIDLEQF